MIEHVPAQPAVPPTNAQRYRDWLVRYTLHARCIHAAKHHTNH